MMPDINGCVISNPIDSSTIMIITQNRGNFGISKSPQIDANKKPDGMMKHLIVPIGTN